MEAYQNLIGVVLEKLGQTYKELKFNYEGLHGVLCNHSEEEISETPELLTIKELRDSYAEFIRTMENRFPGIKSL